MVTQITSRGSASLQSRVVPLMKRTFKSSIFESGHTKPGIEGAIFYEHNNRESVDLDVLTISELSNLVRKG